VINMNMRYWALMLFALIVASGLTYASTVTTTVKYIVPNDLSFTITYPTATTEMWFEPSSQTEEKNATNQTSTTPIIIYTNTGNIAEFYNININTNNPASIVLKCAPLNAGYQSSCGCEGAGTMSASQCCNITTGSSRVNVSSTAISATQTMWCWAQFTSSPAGTTTKTMTSTSAAS
jgi:hypothetical protein